MSETTVNGPEDSTVSEMIKQLPQKKVYEITRCFQDRFVGLDDAPSAWRIVKLIFLQEQDAAPKKEIRSYKAIALASVMSNWSAACGRD